MRRILNFMVHWTWEFPQTCVGLVASLILGWRNGMHKTVLFGYTKQEFKVVVLQRTDPYFSGVSLGRYIVISKFARANVLRHETGHGRQSRMLGWLYLPLVALPSVLLNLYVRTKFTRKRNFNPRAFYYDTYPENWANKLVGLRWHDMDYGESVETLLSYQ